MKKIIYLVLFILLTPMVSFSEIRKENNNIILDEVTFNLLVKDAKLKTVYENQVKELEEALDKLDKNRNSLKKLNEENEELLNKKITLQEDIIKEYKGQKEKYKEIENELNKDIRKLKRKKLTSDILVGLLTGATMAVSDNSNEKIIVGSAAALYFILSNN